MAPVILCCPATLSVGTLKLLWRPRLVIETLVDSSSASTDFKAEVLAFVAGKPAGRVKLESYVPRVKVRRLLTKLLTDEPGLEIERVTIRGTSGCSDFVGSVDVHTST